MKEIQIESCPFCGGTEFIECSMDAYGGVYVSKKLRSVGVYATVCRDCGSIVRSYVRNAEKLLPKNQRKAEQ